METNITDNRKIEDRITMNIIVHYRRNKNNHIYRYIYILLQSAIQIENGQ